MTLMASRAVLPRSMARSVSMVMSNLGTGVWFSIFFCVPIVDSPIATWLSFK